MPEKPKKLWRSIVASDFIKIGERTNVTGSRRFAKAVREGDMNTALAIARRQIEQGALIVDVCMDGALVDARERMVTFLTAIASDPVTSRVPVMIDSPNWSVIEVGLACLQGKGIVNSINLGDGEDPFKEKAARTHGYGAAVVAMAIDEQGIADTAERKIEVLNRAYVILTEQAGFDPSDIILDPAVLAIGTGMKEHENYAVAFIEAVRQLKEALPTCKISGGISNVSFAFRGNDAVREAMHAVFLFHAREAGLDMAIVNPEKLKDYSDIPTELRDCAEDVVLNRRPDATMRLLELARALDRSRSEEESQL